MQQRTKKYENSTPILRTSVHFKCIGSAFSEWTSVPPENQDDFLDIPSTHVWQQVVRRGMTMTDGSSVGPNLDFTSFISANGSSTTGYLGVNSEGGANFGIGDPGQVVFFDLSFNPTSNLWETTSSQQ